MPCRFGLLGADLDLEWADLDSGRAEFGLLCCHLVYRARELGDGPRPKPRVVTRDTGQ